MPLLLELISYWGLKHLLGLVMYTSSMGFRYVQCAAAPLYVFGIIFNNYEAVNFPLGMISEPSLNSETEAKKEKWHWLNSVLYVMHIYVCRQCVAIKPCEDHISTIYWHYMCAPYSLFLFRLTASVAAFSLSPHRLWIPSFKCETFPSASTTFLSFSHVHSKIQL